MMTTCAGSAVRTTRRRSIRAPSCSTIRVNGGIGRSRIEDSRHEFLQRDDVIDGGPLPTLPRDERPRDLADPDAAAPDREVCATDCASGLVDRDFSLDD